MEDEPKIFRQRIMEGLSLRARLAGIVDGADEVFHISLDRIRRQDDGSFTGYLESVDNWAMGIAQETIVLPEEIEWAENEPFVIPESGEEADKRLVSPKVALFIGGATLAGAVAVSYVLHQKKN